MTFDFDQTISTATKFTTDVAQPTLAVLASMYHRPTARERLDKHRLLPLQRCTTEAQRASHRLTDSDMSAFAEEFLRQRGWKGMTFGEYRHQAQATATGGQAVAPRRTRFPAWVMGIVTACSGFLSGERAGAVFRVKNIVSGSAMQELVDSIPEPELKNLFLAIEAYEDFYFHAEGGAGVVGRCF